MYFLISQSIKKWHCLLDSRQGGGDGLAYQTIYVEQELSKTSDWKPPFVHIPAYHPAHVLWMRTTLYTFPYRAPYIALCSNLLVLPICDAPYLMTFVNYTFKTNVVHNSPNSHFCLEQSMLAVRIHPDWHIGLYRFAWCPGIWIQTQKQIQII